MAAALRGIVDTILQENRRAYDKLNLYYQFLPYMLLGQFLGALLLLGLLYGKIKLMNLMIWIGLNGIILLYRAYHYRLFRRAGEEEKVVYSQTWLNRYYTDVLVSGLVWGAAAWLLFPATGITVQLFVLFLLMTIGWISMGLLASKKWLLFVYASFVFLPILARIFLMDHSENHILAVIGLALVLLMLLSAHYYGEIINSALSERINNYVTQHSYQKLNEQFFSLFERAPVGIYHFDTDLLIEDANDYFLKMTGSENKSDIVGADLRHLWPDEAVLQLHERVLRGFGEEYQDTLSATSFGKETTYINLSATPLHDDENNVVGGITILKDVTAEVRAKEDLAHMKYYDELTDLPNRTLLLQHLKIAIDAKLRTGAFGALLFLDIDHFNSINRSYGQKAGDAVLKKIARQLQKSTDSRGTVARIGADTFAILLPVLSADRTESREEVLAFIGALRRAFEKVLVVGDADYHIGFTVGVALFDSSEETPIDILKYAESTMFGAKQGTRGTVRFYEKERDGMALNDMAIANDLHKAIRNNELTMYYQPQQDIHNGILTGAEALVRWNHPKKGPISPAQFVPIAEESGAIIRLEEWIFEQVFRDMRTMADTLIEFPLNYIAVNVSSVHFLQPNFVDKFVEMVHRHRINPLWVNIEITESGIMSNIDEAIARIHELKRLGFGFSIDDFGTGYSSLTYLKKLPVDIIKIDRSFVKDADRNDEDRLIVESVIEISRRFGFKVLAEGIDRQETLDYFRGTACKTFQGYLFYQPISMEEFIQLI